MFQGVKKALAQSIERALEERFGLEHAAVIELPPRRELGDLACPTPLHLAKTLGNKPRQIARQLCESLELPTGVTEVKIEGPGYLNFYLDRSRFASDLLAELSTSSPSTPREGKVIVEHTNINPNKAAHVGHLRNAVLGDVLGRCYRELGYATEIQNYIDDTGVQVADVVVGFVDLLGESLEEVAAHPEPFDYRCWDLYSEVGRWYEEDPERLAFRRQTLRELESGRGVRAEIGKLVAQRIVGRHLETMARLGIGYDLLTRESEILRLDFFSVAFEQLKKSGAVRLEEDGKNAGCWVMPLSESEEFRGLEDPDKVILRSDGTITYVGKDIAYQLWKFGLLGRDFEYRPYSGELWETASNADGTEGGALEQPSFGRADRVVNVIDARQSYLQRIVRVGLESLGHHPEAERSIHFAYEMVSLSAKTAQLLGLGEQAGRSVEMSGRKGIGVKADDLLDQLEAKSREEIQKRNRHLQPGDLDELSRQIAVAALRYFMVKATTTRIIAFDLDEALSFEGDSGPYLQYSLVRAKNIQRRLEEEGLPSSVTVAEIASIASDLWQLDLWDLVLTSSQIDTVVEKATDTLELSLLARLAVDLAQKFHAVYHRHPILHEKDADLRRLRLGVVQIFQRSLERLAGLLGVPAPDRM